jgi:hypothetical protein
MKERGVDDGHIIHINRFVRQMPWTVGKAVFLDSRVEIFMSVSRNQIDACQFVQKMVHIWIGNSDIRTLSAGYITTGLRQSRHSCFPVQRDSKPKLRYCPQSFEVLDTGCGRNNSHISKNHCGVPKAVSGVWSIPLGRVHDKVFIRRHAVVGWAARLCSGGFLKNFHLSGTVNKQNFRYWAAENPLELQARPLHNPKVTVWCTLSSIGVIEPYFWRGWSHSYCECQSILRHVGEFSAPENCRVWGRIQPRGLLVPTGWSYGPYSTSSARNFKGDVPGSSGLLTRGSSVATALAWFKSLWLFLWGYLKAEAFKHRPRSLDQLKEAIQEERLQMYIGRQGHHLDDIIFKNLK